VVFQRGALFSALSVVDNVALALRELKSYDRDFIRETALLLLDRVGIGTEHADKLPSELSGGMAKRVALARALALAPEILFLDEPTTGLDVEARETLWSTLRALVGEGCAIVLTTHYLEEAEALAQRVGVLARGRVVASGDIHQIRARVSQRRIRCMSAIADETIAAWPDVRSVAREGTRLEIITDAAENVVRQLLQHDQALSELEVRRAGLAEAFAEITREAA